VCVAEADRDTPSLFVFDANEEGLTLPVCLRRFSREWGAFRHEQGGFNTLPFLFDPFPRGGEAPTLPKMISVCPLKLNPMNGIPSQPASLRNT
jgi:hypothetical protein